MSDFMHKADMRFKTPLGARLYELTSWKVKLKLRQISSTTKSRIVRELGLKANVSPEELAEAIQAKINEIKTQIFESALRREPLGEGYVRYIACERSALVLGGSTGWTVSYYSTEDLQNSAKPRTEHADQGEAEEHARKWVLEVR